MNLTKQYEKQKLLELVPTHLLVASSLAWITSSGTFLQKKKKKSSSNVPKEIN